MNVAIQMGTAVFRLEHHHRVEMLSGFRTVLEHGTHGGIAIDVRVFALEVGFLCGTEGNVAERVHETRVDFAHTGAFGTVQDIALGGIGIATFRQSLFDSVLDFFDVGAGNVLNDLLRCTQIPSTRLQHIFRQAGGNDIADKAAKINQGVCPSPIEGTNFHFLPYETADEAKDIIARLVTCGIKEKLDIDTQEMQLLTPMRKGPLGIYELNIFLQDLLNPGKERIKIASGNWITPDLNRARLASKT